MNKQLSSAIVRIFTATGDIAGVGFLIPEKQVLTYTEVVARALNLQPSALEAGSQKPAGRISLDFPLIAPGEKMKATVSFWQPGAAAGAAGEAGGAGDASAANLPWGAANIALLEMETAPPERAALALIQTPNDEHYWNVIDSITAGRVVTFLGAGASLFGRPPGFSFGRGGEYLPSGGELSEHLARKFRYVPNDLHDLLRVSQYVSLRFGQGPLYETLREIFSGEYKATGLHQFFARLPATLRAKKYPKPYQLIVTTNYDDLLERAFEEESVREPYDLITYIADGKLRGKFLHRRYNGQEPAPDGSLPVDYMPDGMVRVIDKPNEDLFLSLDKRSVILKIHGAMDRTDPERDSYVITEDHYIDYLTRTDLSNLIPATLAAKLRRSHFLFLGYSLRDWNLRVILYRIWGEQKLGFKSWSIQLKPQNLDKEFWEGRGVDILDAQLENYIAELDERIQSLPEVQ